MLETSCRLRIDFYEAKFISFFLSLNFSLITFISVRVGKGNQQRMRLFLISECFSNKCSWKNPQMFLKPEYFWTIPFENDSFSWLIITFRYKIYSFCKNILYCFLPIEGKISRSWKVWYILKTRDAYSNKYSTILMTPALKTYCNCFIRFLLKNVLRYCKLNQSSSNPFSDQVEMSWFELDFQIKTKGLIKEEIVSLSFGVKKFQAKKN